MLVSPAVTWRISSVGTAADGVQCCAAVSWRSDGRYKPVSLRPAVIASETYGFRISAWNQALRCKSTDRLSVSRTACQNGDCNACAVFSLRLDFRRPSLCPEEPIWEQVLLLQRERHLWSVVMPEGRFSGCIDQSIEVCQLFFFSNCGCEISTGLKIFAFGSILSESALGHSDLSNLP